MTLQRRCAIVVAIGAPMGLAALMWLSQSALLPWDLSWTPFMVAGAIVPCVGAIAVARLVTGPGAALGFGALYLLVIAGLLAVAGATAILQQNSVLRLTNRSDAPLTDVTMYIGDAVLRPGDLAPGKTHTFRGRPHGEGSMRVTFNGAGGAQDEAFGYVVSGLSIRCEAVATDTAVDCGCSL